MVDQFNNNLANLTVFEINQIPYFYNQNSINGSGAGGGGADSYLSTSAFGGCGALAGFYSVDNASHVMPNCGVRQTINGLAGEALCGQSLGGLGAVESLGYRGMGGSGAFNCRSYKNTDRFAMDNTFSGGLGGRLLQITDVSNPYINVSKGGDGGYVETVGGVTTAVPPASGDDGFIVFIVFHN